MLSHYPMQYIYANNLIHVGLIEQTVLLIILFLGQLHSGDTKFGAGKCAHNLCIYYLTLSNPGYHYRTQGTYQDPVVQKLDNAIHRINRYPVDKYYES